MCDHKLDIWITVQTSVYKKTETFISSYANKTRSYNYGNTKQKQTSKTSYVLSDKRYALRCFLKTLKDLIERNAYGSLFHSVGPYTENARS